MRLWYVAATRARELLVLPRLDVKEKSSAWNAVVQGPALPSRPLAKAISNLLAVKGMKPKPG